MHLRGFGPIGWVLLLCGLVGCESAVNGLGRGGVDEPTSSADDPSLGADDPESGPRDGTVGTSRSSLCVEPGMVSPRGVRRLNRVAYINTLTSLFGTQVVTSDVVRAALEGLPEEGFDEAYQTKERSAGLGDATAYFRVASAIGATVVANDASLRTLFRCLPDKTTRDIDKCMEDFVPAFLRRVYRRPPDSDEVQALTSVYLHPAVEDHRDGIMAMIQVALQSLEFHYFLEDRGEVLESTPDERRLTAHELASRLSYALWQDMPDEELLIAADSGSLSDPSVYETQVRRLVRDPKSKSNFRNFAREWMELDDLPPFNFTTGFLDGQSTQNLQTAAVDEALDFFDHVVWDMNGGFSDLMTSNVAFIQDPALAEVYGLGENAVGEVTLPEHRSGLLTRAGVILSGRDTVSPILRGVKVLRQVLCDEPPPPPDDIDIDGALEAVSWEGNSTRVYYNEVTKEQPCISCHTNINPVGHMFGPFDGLGRFSENEKRYDDDGSFLESFEVVTSGTFFAHGVEINAADAVNLSEVVASSAQARECLIEHLFIYTFGRERAREDGCYLEDVYETMASEDGTLENLLVRLVTSPDFQRKRVRP